MMSSSCYPVDRVDLTDSVLALYRRGAIAPAVPVLAGSVREDLGFLGGMKVSRTQTQRERGGGRERGREGERGVGVLGWGLQVTMGQMTYYL